MKKIYFLLFLLLIPFVCTNAQRKEISQAKSFVKSGNNLQQAEQMMSNLLKDSTNRQKDKIWLILFEAVKKQYDQGNEQLYLKQKYDTAQLFNSARKMFIVLEGLDSIDMTPDRNGKVKLKYRKKHADFLNTYRPNIYSGGMFFVRKRDYSNAFNFFSTYIDCVKQPLFSGYKYETKDRRLTRAAYMAVYCGYKLKDFDKTMRYADIALKDTSRLNFLYQYFAEMYIQHKDTAKYVEALSKGFERYPKSMYFFPRIFDHWFKSGDMQRSLSLCDKVLAQDSTNMVFLYAKSTVLLSLGRYAETVSICDRLIARNDTLADAYLTAGLAYYNQAVKLGSDAVTSRRENTALRRLYKSALPYLERYRALVPAGKDKWAFPLYTIYLNLNMGKEFDEIDSLMNKK